MGFRGPAVSRNTRIMVTVGDQLETSTMGEAQDDLVGKDADKQGDRSIRC